MPSILVRSMMPEDEIFISTCSHVDESAEIDAAAELRLLRLQQLRDVGSVVKVGFLDRRRVGFAHGLPIEQSPWGPRGGGLMTIPCLFVVTEGAKAGVGRALVEAIEREARQRGHTGIAVVTYRNLPGADWFMPAAFFEHLGYQLVEERGREVLLWKPISDEAECPHFLEPRYTYTPVDDKAVVDLFWNDFCPTSGIEAERVRRVCAEFGERVLLRAFCADDHGVLMSCGIPRAIYVNGREISWGYEAPEDGIREAIRSAMDRRP